jgi:hypothetical protein
MRASQCRSSRHGPRIRSSDRFLNAF